MRRIAFFCLTLCLAAPLQAEERTRLAPLAESQWDATKAAHLLNRAGFGATPEEIIRLASMSLEQAVAFLLDYQKHSALPQIELPKFDPTSPRAQRRIQAIANRYLKQQRETRRKNLLLALENALRFDKSEPREQARESKKDRQKRRRRDRFKRMTRGMTAEQGMRYVAELRAKNRALRGHDRQNIQFVRAWWIERMIRTERPLEEKMALFWHGHFASGYRTVRSTKQMLAQNELFRSHATGNFAELVLRIARDPAMLRYLDGNRNIKGKPNENFARELLELFTIGIGNYSETDIKEAARAFTGWSFNRERYGKQRKGRRQVQPGFVFRRYQHDYGQKTFMGQTGNHNGQDVIDIIMAQPATARFIVTKLCKFFMIDQPDPALVAELAETFRSQRYEIKPVLRQLFSAAAFYTPRVMGSQIKSPTQLLVGTARLLGVPSQSIRYHALRTLPRLGQNLFEPPNVKGWDGGRAWVNAATLLIRYNLTRDILLGQGRMRKRTRKRKKAKKPKAGQNEMRMEDPMARRKRNRNRRGRPLNVALLKRFESYESATEVINHLTLLFLQRPLPESRMAQLRAVLMPEGATFEPKSRETQQRIIQLIILITSMPEYQLC